MNKAMLNAVFSSQELFEYSSNPKTPLLLFPLQLLRIISNRLGGEARQLNPICVRNGYTGDIRRVSKITILRYVTSERT